MTKLFKKPNASRKPASPNSARPRTSRAPSRPAPRPSSNDDDGLSAQRSEAPQRASEGGTTAGESRMTRIEAVISRSVEITRKLTFAGAFIVGLVLLLCNIVPANQAVQSFLELVPHTKQISAGALTMAFDEPSVSLGVDIEISDDSEHKGDSSYAGKIIQMVKSLDSDHYRRLMYVEQVQNLCDFEQPSFEMERDLSLDEDLADKGLVTLQNDDAILDQVMQNVRKDDPEGAGPPNGYPRYCYRMTLTDVGADVKTALVKTIGSLFEVGLQGRAKLALQ